MNTRTVRAGPVALPARVVSALGALVLLEGVALGAYLLAADVSVISLRYLLYPFVWVNVAVAAVLATDRPAAGRQARLLAGGVAAGYLGVLLAVTGVVGFRADHLALVVRWDMPPGWGPLLALRLPPLAVSLGPYELVGYLGLAYLVYVAVLDAGRSVAGGLVGLASCVSCTLPLAAAALTGVLGGTSPVAAAAYGASYDLSTLAFVAAVALLYWRPHA